ncbi:MAG: Dipeptide and tripeptide permease A [Chlamydiia bacterium]|nr:Dipeptide and tripeptide permease A [Chlamydiia bacterium]MCH9615844.1 Dipeptide and tripeptide permease A [Chlamydiia bacterium]MCH9628753.1 Dipeptide and tripeptide permease A [Chlamydiia bacterium]
MTAETSYIKNHPKEMFLLAMTEMCQRFAFWGVGNLLVLYLIQYFHFSTPRATHLYGVFTGVGFVLPLLGGYIADRWNYKSPVIWGTILSAIGCFFIGTTSLALLYPGLLCIALGGSIFTPSIYALLGKVYHGKHHLRQVGFSIYYAAVNIGIFVAMIVLGVLIHHGLWSLVFFIAGIVQLCGLIFFKMTLNYFNQDDHKIEFKKEDEGRTPLDKVAWQRMIVIIVISLISIIFWAAYAQNASSLVVYALKYTQRIYGGFEIPVPWLITTETFFLLVLVAPLSAFYLFLRKRGWEPSPICKTALAFFALAICFIIMTLSTNDLPKANPFFMIGAFFFMAVAEMLIAPIGLSMLTDLSPKQFTGFFVGAWYFCIGIAFYFGGVLAGLIAKINLQTFFLIFVLTAVITGIILLIFTPLLNRMRHAESLPKFEE